MKKPLSLYRFILAWAKLQFRIKSNLFVHALSFFKKKQKALLKVRQPYFHKNTHGIFSFLLSAFFFFLYFFLFFNLSFTFIQRIDKVIPYDVSDTLEKHLPPLPFSVTTTLEDLEEEVNTKLAAMKKVNRKEELSQELRRDILFKSIKLKRGQKSFNSLYERMKYDLTVPERFAISASLTERAAEKIIQIYIDKGYPYLKENMSDFDFFPRFFGRRAEIFIFWLGTYFLIVMIGLVMAEGIGNKNPIMHSPENNLDSYFALPVKPWVLCSLPFIQRLFFNPLTLYVAFPPTFMASLALGFPFFKSLAVAACATMVFAISLSSLQIVYQLIGRFSRSKLIRILLAYLQIPGYAILCIAYGIFFVYSLPRSFISLAMWNPGKYLPATLIVSISRTGAYWRLWEVIVITAAFPLLAFLFIRFFTRNGLPSIPMRNSSGAGSRYSVKNRAYLFAIMRAFRDRQYFIQTFLIPPLLFCFYYYMFLMNNPLALFSSGKLSADEGILRNGMLYLTILYASSVFIFMGSLFRFVAQERDALWFFYTAPKPVEKILRVYIISWLTVVMIYFMTGIIVMSYLYPFNLHLILKASAFFLGLIPMAFISMALSFSAYKAPQMIQDNPSPYPIVTFHLLWIASLFGAAIYYGPPGSELTMLILFCFVATGLWKDLNRVVPVFLDPGFTATPRLTLNNTLNWVLFFFSLRIIIDIIAGVASQPNSAVTVGTVVAYAIAGCVSVGLASLWGFRIKVPSLSKKHDMFSGLRLTLAFIAMLAALAAFATFYFPLVKNLSQHLYCLKIITKTDRIIVSIYFCLFAPVLEEVLFRRFLFRALLQDFSSGKALLFNALIFASISPVSNFLPLLCLGLCCGWIYLRSGKLYSAVMLHSLFNLYVIYACM